MITTKASPGASLQSSRRWVAFLVALCALSTTLVASTISSASADDSDDADFSRAITVTNRTFYPLIEDKYRDEAVIDVDYYFDYRKFSGVVYNEKNRPVRDLKFRYECWKWDHDCDEPFRRAKWDGRKNDGTFAAKGEYTVVMTAITEIWDGSESVDVPVKAERALVLDGGMKRRHFIREKVGTSTASRSKGKNCYIDSWREQLELACWQGTQASATWRFKVPASADKIRRFYFGDAGYNHEGRLILSGKRVNKTTYVAKATVTKWRSEYFESVDIRFWAKVPV